MPEIQLSQFYVEFIGFTLTLIVALAMRDCRQPLVLIDCPPSLGLLTINALFAADLVLVVTEPGAWAVDGVTRMLQTVERIRDRRPGRRPEVAGIAVNRLGRTRDARYWSDQLAEAYPTSCLPVIHLRTAISEAAAQSLPVHALGARPGAAEAAEEFDILLSHILEEDCEMAVSEPDGDH